MLESLKRYVFGTPAPLPAVSVESLPRESRQAHHDFMNVAMKMKKVANDIDENANDLIELLARDLRRRSQ